MPRTRLLLLTLALTALLLASLACQIVLEGEEGSLDEEANAPAAAESTPTAEAVEKSPDPSPTAEPTSEPLQKPRLDSSALPALSFGPVGPSPAAAGRVQLSGSPQSLDTEHFRIHYTLSGADAVSDADSDGNGHPDYVEQVAIALEYAWFSQIEYFGWPAPPPDEGLGGNNLYDVYLENIFDDGTAGYVDGGYSDAVIGDNPNSATVEDNASHSYMAVDNDYAGFEEFESGGVSAMDFMRSTVAHEFMHSIQYGMDSFEPHDWLWEASANWVQDEVLNDYNDAIEDAYSVFKSPDSCQLSYGGEERIEDENHWYGLWVFIRYYSESYGHQAVRELWETTISEDGYAVWDEELAERGSSLAEFFEDFSVALLLRDFEEGANYPSVRLEGTASLGQLFEPQSGVGQMAADYVQIEASGPITIVLDSDDLEGVAVGIDGGVAQRFPLEDGEVGLDAGDYEYLYLIVINPERAENEDACEFYDYTVQVQSGASLDGSASESQPAPNFTPPNDEGLEGFVSEGGGSGEPIGEEPEELALVYLPDGYSFVQAAEIGREDFYDPDFVDNYIPGAGPATVLDYYGPGEEDYISLYASESPHADLDAYLDDIAYDPSAEELRDIAGYEVLLEVFGEESSPFSVATLVIEDIFIVFEGTIAPDEMVEVVSAWLLSE